MGIIKKGANGAFRGKAGSVIGSGWKKIDYIKGRPRTYKNKGNPSETQMKQQEKFALLNNFLAPLRNLLKIGFANYLAQSTPRNAAFRYNFDHAFLSSDDNKFSLNYAALQFSRGSLFSAGGEKAILTTEGIQVTWNIKTYGLSGSMDDEVHVFAYFEQQDSLKSDEQTPLRYQGETFIEQQAQKGEPVHIWMFMADSQHKRISPTTYLFIQNDSD